MTYINRQEKVDQLNRSKKAKALGIHADGRATHKSLDRKAKQEVVSIYSSDCHSQT